MHPPRIALATLALILLAAGCSAPPRPPESGPAVQAEPRPPEPAVPVAEDPNERTRRLLRLEQACDQWNEAQLHQEYARMESLANLLEDFTRQHFEAIVSDLRHGSPRYRKMMAAALGFSHRPEAVPPLLEALRDPYYEVVLHSLLSIYHLTEPSGPRPVSARGDPPAPIVIDPEALVPYLQHPKGEVRSNAALALSRIVGPGTSKSVLLALINVLADSEASTRNHAVAALGSLRDKEALPHLVKTLEDPVELVRLRSALALGRIGDPSSAPYLIEVLTRAEEAVDVRKAAAKALGTLLGEEDTTSIDPAWWQAKIAAR